MSLNKKNINVVIEKVDDKDKNNKKKDKDDSDDDDDLEKSKNKKRVYGLNVKKMEKSKQHILMFTKKITSYPPIVDLRKKLPVKIYDQGSIGSCTANALCVCIQYLKPTLAGSRLFLYYNERLLNGTVNEDSGALLVDGINSLKKHGICKETLWPYKTSNLFKKPTQNCYKDAIRNRATIVKNINDDIDSMKKSLINNVPFVVGILIYESFESENVAKTGYVPMPDKDEEMLGGHAVVCCGYNDTKKVWIMRNSWGSDWGDKGYFYLPYEYLVDSEMSTELWCVIKI